MLIYLTIITIASYLLAAGLQYLRASARFAVPKSIIAVLSLVALLLHAYILHRGIDTRNGQNLSWLNIASLLAWLIALQISLTALRKPLDNLLIVISPLVALSILFAHIFPHDYIIHAHIKHEQLLHILLAILSFSVLALSGLQALVIHCQHQQLRSTRPQRLAHYLPPLETMEALLFQMITVGFLLLSLSLLTGFVFLQESGLHWPLQKISLSIFAWLLFASLLLGHWRWGLRGKKALQATWLGLGLLALGYAVSRLWG